MKMSVELSNIATLDLQAAKDYKKMRDAEWNRVFMIQIDWRGKATHDQNR